MVLNVTQNVTNFYDIRNQLLNSIDTQAKEKNATFVANAADLLDTPPSGQHSGLIAT